MKPASVLLGALSLLYSCGESTAGMGTVTRKTEIETAKNLEVSGPSARDQEVYEISPGEIDYGPEFFPHTDTLENLLLLLRKGKAILKKENSEEGIDRPYIQVDEVIIYPYLDTLDGNFLSKVIDVSGNEYLIMHARGSATSATGILSSGLKNYLGLLQAGKTVTYPVYDELQ